MSKGWGGRVSDKHLTANSGFLNHFVPGDLVLADRGFDIAEDLSLVGASCTCNSTFHKRKGSTVTKRGGTSKRTFSCENSH